MSTKILRPIDANDYDQLYAWDSQETQHEYYTCRPLLLEKTKEAFIFSIESYVLANKCQYWVLVEANKPEELLVKIACFDFNPRNKSLELGIYLPPDLRGSGYGKIALKLMLKELFVKFDYNKVYATTASNNTAAIALFNSCNFKQDGCLREHYWIGSERYDQIILSILKADWQAATALA